MYSVSQGKFSIPKLGRANKASIKGEKLIESKGIITDLHNKLKTKTEA